VNCIAGLYRNQYFCIFKNTKYQETGVQSSDFHGSFLEFHMEVDVYSLLDFLSSAVAAS
jgi:hypothetical protein